MRIVTAFLLRATTHDKGEDSRDPSLSLVLDERVQFCLLISLAVIVALGVGKRHACTTAAKDEPEEFKAEELHHAEHHPDKRISIQCRPEHKAVRAADWLASVIGLVTPDLVAKMIYLAPPAEVDKETASHVLDRPEVKCSKDNDGEEGDNIVTNHHVQEYEAEE